MTKKLNLKVHPIPTSLGEYFRKVNRLYMILFKQILFAKNTILIFPIDIRIAP